MGDLRPIADIGEGEGLVPAIDVVTDNVTV